MVWTPTSIFVGHFQGREDVWRVLLLSWGCRDGLQRIGDVERGHVPQVRCLRANRNSVVHAAAASDAGVHMARGDGTEGAHVENHEAIGTESAAPNRCSGRCACDAYRFAAQTLIHAASAWHTL